MVELILVRAHAVCIKSVLFMAGREKHMPFCLKGLTRQNVSFFPFPSFDFAMMLVP